MGKDTRPEYWREYTNLQHVKHQLIKEYLNGWFPKLGYWSGRILYFDTHAGRGRHLAGEYGSPLVALQTFLKHSHRDRILENSEVRFFFAEIDEENLTVLEKEIAKLGKLPPGVHVKPSGGDCFGQLEAIINNLNRREKRLAPAFLFIDPYGFKVPGRLLRHLMQFDRVELFVNVIWRELDMAIIQARSNSEGMAKTLDEIFDGSEWRERIVGDTIDQRADAAIDLIRDMCKAEWATAVRMMGANGQTRYLLVHLTNHEAGRDLMKDCIWKVCPDGGFYARRSDNPNQTLLITPEPNLADLEEWLLRQLEGGPKRWSELTEAIRGELWRSKHLNEVIRRLRRRKTISATEYSGRFSQKADPLLELKS